MNTCDHGHQTRQRVKILPVSPSSNVIVCYKHYAQEMSARKRKEKEYGNKQEYPNWLNLESYKNE